MPFVHKSSIAIHKSRLLQNKHDVALDVAIQTEPEMDIENGMGSVHFRLSFIGFF